MFGKRKLGKHSRESEEAASAVQVGAGAIDAGNDADDAVMSADPESEGAAKAVDSDAPVASDADEDVVDAGAVAEDAAADAFDELDDDDDVVLGAHGALARDIDGDEPADSLEDDFSDIADVDSDGDDDALATEDFGDDEAKADGEDAVQDDADSALDDFDADAYTVPIVTPDGQSDAFGTVAPATGAVAAAGQPIVMPKKKPNGKKIAGIVAGSLVGILGIAYAAGAFYFTGHMFPNTTVGDSDISYMATQDVESMLTDKTQDYGLKVEGYDYELVLPGNEIGFNFDSVAVTQDMHAQQNVFKWPAEFFNDHDYADLVKATFSEDTVKSLIGDTVETHNESARDNVDARIGYSDEQGKVVVIPEEYGTKLNADAVFAAAKKAISSATRTAELVQDDLIQPDKKKDDPALVKAADGCNNLTKANMTITFGDEPVLKVGLPCVDKFVDIADDGEVTLNPDKVADWISDTATACSTVGSERTYTRPDGKEITVDGGSYGWEVDEEALRDKIIEGLESDSTDTFEMPCTQTGAVFTAAGEPDWGSRYIDVDLSEQYARFYDGDDVIWESPIISGNINIADRATPTGVWFINTMGTNVTLHTYEPGKKEPNDTLVYYWMPFVGNSVGLHDAWWQPGFGGTMYADGYGSHGCVNLPSSAAAELYGIAEVGDVVITHW